MAGSAPADVRALTDLLSKPDVQSWLRLNEIRADPVRPPDPASLSEVVGSRLDAARETLKHLWAAVPKLPAQFRIIERTLGVDVSHGGFLGFAGPLVAFAALGALAETVFWRSTAGLRRRISACSLETVEDRLKAVCRRSLYGLGVVGSFAAGSGGAFLAIDWPPTLQRLVLTYLIVVISIRLTLVGCRVILAPDAERFRLLPMADRTARYWSIWSATLVGAFYFAKGTFRLVPVLGADQDTRTLVGSVLSVILLALALMALWRRPSFAGGDVLQRSQEGSTWLVTAYLCGVWLTVFSGQTAPFDIGIVLLLVVLAVFGLRLAISHLLQEQRGRGTPYDGRPLAVVAFHSGLRIVLISGGALIVANILGIDLTSLTARDSATMRTARAVLDVAIIALVADFIWQMARVSIDDYLDKKAPGDQAATDDEARRRQRLRTLLPVLRHALLVTIAGVAGLTALSTLGVAVGPLIAGAGVAGIAIGFGAQTLVKDIISGLLFLFDDAFRTGETIESGGIKGKVEAFSLRSVKLRHDDGALHTVPFGSLSTITNFSRDWVVDTFLIGVTYDTDLDTVRRIITEIGEALRDDPLFSNQILENLHMLGLETFGDFAIQISITMKTRPGKQVAIRRQAHSLIKRAFDDQGIEFASSSFSKASRRRGQRNPTALPPMGIVTHPADEQPGG